MSEGCISKFKRGNKTYYYYSRSYRVKVDPNAEGKTKCSGKSKVLTERYYLGQASDILNRFKDNSKVSQIEKKEFGLPLALWNIANEIDLIDIIDRTIPKRNQGLSIGEYIVINAISRVSPTPPSKSDIENWIKKSCLLKVTGKGSLSSQSFWNNFEKVMSEAEIKSQEELDSVKIEKIEEAIWEKLIEKYGFLLDVVLYDTTNFATFIDKFTDSTLPGYGRNKHGMNNKRQVGLSLAVLNNTQIPLFHELYQGSINDVTLFPSAINKLVSRISNLTKDVSKIILVFDKGNNSEKNILNLEEAKIDFVGSLTPSQHKDILRIPLSKYRETIGDSIIYRTKKELYGRERTVIVSYSENSKKRQLSIFTDKLNAVKRSIRDIYDKNRNKGKENSEIQKIMDSYLKSIKIDTARASYYIKAFIEDDKLRIRETDNVKWKKLSFGKTIYFSSLLNAETGTIIKYYKDKNKIEDVFKILNNYVSFQPVRSWTDSKIKVHAFVCVIALLLVKLLEYISAKNGLSMSTKVLINELRDITEVILLYPDLKVDRQICNMTTIQKALFDLFNLSKFT